MKTLKLTLILSLVLFVSFAEAQNSSSIGFIISMDNPSSHTFHVVMNCKGFRDESINLNMPVWSPGYYQKLDFANNVENFNATDSGGKNIGWEKVDENTWKVKPMGKSAFVVTYDVKTIRPFVGNPYLDENRGYILPAALCFNINNMIDHPVRLTIIPASGWKDVATGLDKIGKENFVYAAPDFDVLYDSPILVGNLEQLEPFYVRGIPHYFMGYNIGDFDKKRLMSDLQKIVETAVNMIGDIPYSHYTFIAIGPGRGGIEHLNSTAFGFNGNNLNSNDAWLRNLFFLSHEYFHHFNVKRIRPVELGPFDYDHGSRTNLLWVSEGLSVYYEYMLVKRAGLCSDNELFEAFRSNILAYENNPGRFFQTLAESSYYTWSDGPFGRSGGDVNKSISYYNKGPLVGLLLDFKIRHETQNQRSLDDVMKVMYNKYYLEKKRGFTDAEFQAECERTAGVNLAVEFEYITTTQPLAYPKYLDYAGLSIDTTDQVVAGGWLGISTRNRNDSAFVVSVDWKSPAWNAGIRPGSTILEINDQSPGNGLIPVIESEKPGNEMNLIYLQGGSKNESRIKLGSKYEKSFTITPQKNNHDLPQAILDSWLEKE